MLPGGLLASSPSLLAHLSPSGLQAEVETARAAAAAQRAQPTDSATGAVISDEAMAAALARAQQRAGDGTSGAGAASDFQRPAAMAPVHFWGGETGRAPAAGIMPAAGNGNAAAAAAVPTAAAAAAAGMPAGNAASPDEASREQDQVDSDGILRFGDEPVQQASPSVYTAAWRPMYHS